MSSGKKLRPGVANEHEIRLNLRLLRGRDGPLFKAVHELVADLGPRQRVEALRLWMMAAATSASTQPVAAQGNGPIGDGTVATQGTANERAASPTADAARQQVAVASPAVSSSGTATPGKLDMSQLNGVEMDLDFMGAPAR